MARSPVLTIAAAAARGWRARGRRRRRARRPQRGTCAKRSRATLELIEYEKRDISHAELRAAYQEADEQIKLALEPFGYYDVEVKKELDRRREQRLEGHVQGDAGRAGHRAQAARRGAGRGQGAAARGRGASPGFAPKVGERLDHATYEASKAVIDTCLRGSGYLDAKYHAAARDRAARKRSPPMSTCTGRAAPRYKFGDVRFTGDAPFPESFLREFVPWREDAYFNSEQVLNLQQRLVDADYFELVSVAPALDEKKDGRVPIDVLLNRDERTVYSGEVYYSTDFGAGVRVGAERRWLNKKGHKADAQVEYSQRLQEAAVHYQIPRPGREDRSYDFGAAYRDETTDVSRSRNFQLAASRSEKRWHGFTRTIGLKYLRRRFRDRPGRGRARVRQLASCCSPKAR